MKINKIIETVIYCDDVQEMFNFYQNVFNFEVMSKHFPRSVFLRCGESVLVIMNRSMTSEEGQLPPKHGTIGAQHFALEVDDDQYEDRKKLFLEK
jgi:catechol-2,3-dioxygenase